MSDLLHQVEQKLLFPEDLAIHDLEKILGQVASRQVDYADVYLQSYSSESWVLEDGIIKDANFNVSRGAGIRAVYGEKTGFAYSTDLALPALAGAAKAARGIALQGGHQSVHALQQKTESRALLYSAVDPLMSLDSDAKVRLLQLLDAEARAQDPRVVQVIASLSASYETVLVAATDGTLAADIRPLMRVNVNVIVEENGRRETANAGGGGRFDYRSFLREDNAQALFYAREAVRQAVVALSAEPAPVGMMPVVLGAGWPGVLLHEAIGHGLEGDFNRKGTSAFANRMGQQVASSLCTIVDDGTLKQRRGSLNVDDEGTPTSCTTLIENGILKGYLQDKLNARLMGMQPTGNGRRESYAHCPMPRMTNTYMLPGSHTREEIIASVKKGIYAVNFSGGQVDITSGKFVFSANEAYLIEDGKITRPVKGAMLIGNGPEVLTKVSMVGNDFALDEGVGVCGKDGQSVPVGVGQPTLKVDMLTVGGTEM